MTEPHTDLLIVGGGIVGLAHAFEAHRRGLSVRVVERDWAPNGASIRNFGHACITAQAGDLLPIAYRSRDGWLAAAQAAGFWAREAGAIVVARTDLELAVLDELRQERGDDAVIMQTKDEVGQRLGGTPDPTIVGGAFLPADLRVDPRTAAPELGLWLQEQPGVSIEWGTTVGAVADGAVSTSRGEFTGDRVLICVGHDLDYLKPDVAAANQITRCSLQMAMAPAPASFTTESAVLTGTSMTRYDGFTTMPGYAEVLAELQQSSQDMLDFGANIMFTRRPDGTMLLGDSHAYADTMPPFMEDSITERAVRDISQIIGAPLPITQRWQGIYASSPLTSLVREDVDARTRAISVTSGIGMTLSFGIASYTLDDLGAAPVGAGAGAAAR